ncbi:hypothetical protein TEA_008796 [Camellia sinensis var. sinensis]|uniref:EF-hand domain-containing protein n=1 Tax=Camellia sinensis var. sinensis TaxID=542762 RepID=A0A4S4DI08_CAMSN|nr:hypothetical protein TEA_008796 [Camellia sinensis var. sinensis]
MEIHSSPKCSNRTSINNDSITWTKVWAIADSKRQGFLGFAEFIAAMQPLAVDLENLKPPVMEGLDAILAKKKKCASKTSDLELNGSLPQSSSANWFTSTKSTKKVPISSVTSIVDGLKKLYIQKLRPLEVTYRFNDFESPLLNGPAGNTIAVQADMPFSGLTTFGTSFLSKFECSQMPHPLLEHTTFVDTPGVLAGEKQRTHRSYDFTGVTSWFAAKCNLILLLFDPHKLDISDEFKRVISSLRGHDDKIRVVLNKSDQVDTQQLMRVYGALMWSLGKVLNTPEKPVNEAVAGPTGKELFKKEQDDLFSDLKGIPKKACDRQINEFVKRARAAKIHAYIIGHLKKAMPAMMGKAKAQLFDNLEDEFAKVSL